MVSLIEKNLFETRDAVADAIARLRGYEPLAGKEGYWVGFSGGKDSVVILELCKMAGVKFEAHHSLTTIDPPELVQFIRATPGVIIDHPEKNFLEWMLEKKFPPLRHQRWCCEKLKENGGLGRLVVTGIRWEESSRRASRREFETCYRGKGTRFLHPIIGWTEAQVWAFIRSRGLPYCRLYDEGRSRLGCLFCPMAKPSQRRQDCEKYPRYEALFRRYFRRLFALRHSEGKVARRWRNGDEMFDWWINETKIPPVANGRLFENQRNR